MGIRRHLGIALLMCFSFVSREPSAEAQTCDVTPTHGPSAGEIPVLVTNTSLQIGNGSDITNVTVGGEVATITGQFTNWVALIAPLVDPPGAKDIVVQSTSIGDTTFASAYTVNPRGVIGGSVTSWDYWTEEVGLPAARMDPASGVLNGSLYVAGGYDLDDNKYSNVYRYNGTNWTEAQAMPVALSAAGCAVASNTLYVIGGFDDDWQCQTNVLCYDGTNWAETTGLPAARAALAVGAVSGVLYAAGGSDEYYTATTNVYRFNGTNWTEVVGLPGQRNLLAGGVLHGALHALGGYDDDNFVTNVYRFDTTHWTEVSGLSTGLLDPAVMVLSNYMYAVGGYDESGSITNAFRFDGTNWYEVGGLPAQRARLGGGTLEGKLYVVGGCRPYGIQVTNMFCSPGTLHQLGVAPSTGSYTGGYTVVLTGSNLCNGTDTTNITICGVAAASISSQSSTQMVVVAGAATAGVSGDVAVYSESYGMTVKTNSFTYEQFAIQLLGTNDEVVTNGEAAERQRGTDFGSYMVGPPVTNTFVITNTGNMEVTISGWTTNGAGAPRFAISGIPSTLPVSSATDVDVSFSPSTGGMFEAELLIVNDATNYTVNLRGGAANLVPSTGPFVGGNAITITNVVLGNGSNITNVLVGGLTATITEQGSNWVTVIVPVAGAPGEKDLLIQSASAGDTFFAGAYTVNPTGQIGGLLRDWTQWEEVQGLPVGRSQMAGGILNDRLYVAGGSQTNTYCYDWTNWTEVSGLPAPRGAFAGGVLNGALYAVGGYDGGSVKTNVYRYSGATWMEVSGLPVARETHAIGIVNGALYVIAGDNGITYQTNVFRYDGANWTEVAGLPGPRRNPAAAVLGDDLYVMGGTSSGGVHTNVYRFDGMNWIEVAGLPAPRRIQAAATLDGAIYAVGGYDYSSPQTNLYRYDGTNWSELRSLPAPRYAMVAAAHGGQLYVVGGSSSSTNVYRCTPSFDIDPGVLPAAASCTGGYSIVITGASLGDGMDVTNVTLCGGQVVEIVSQSSTQIVVTASTADPGPGDIVVHSTSFGTTTKSNGFVYNPFIAAAAGIHGTMTSSGIVDIAYGSDTSFVAVADTYYHVGSFLTNGVLLEAATNQRTWTSVWLNVTATGSLSATFAENVTTNTGTPEWWLASYGWTNAFEAAAINDADDDGALTWAEHRAGTVPTNPSSALTFIPVPREERTGVVVRWQSVNGKRYRLERATNLLDPSPFSTIIRTNILGIEPANTETDEIATAEGPWYYRIKVE